MNDNEQRGLVTIHRAGWQYTHERDAELIRKDGMMCEAHPGLKFGHDADCGGPGTAWAIEGRAAIEALVATPQGRLNRKGDEGEVSAVIKISDHEELSAQRWQCGSCDETFIYVGRLPSYCPECGEEFTSVLDGRPGVQRAMTSYTQC